MRILSSNHFRCPACGGEVCERYKTGQTQENHEFFCRQCQTDYQVYDGIPHFFKSAELSGSNARMEKFYNMWSNVYNYVNKVQWIILGGEGKLRYEFLDKLSLKPGTKILEVSIGTGRNIPYILRKQSNVDYYGIDLSRGQLDKCIKYIKKKKFPVGVCAARAEALPFPDNYFDVVFHCGGFNFFENKKKALCEMVRVARSGSKMVVADENRKGQEMLETLGYRFMGWDRNERVVIPDKADLPEGACNLKVHKIWRGYGFCLEFEKS